MKILLFCSLTLLAALGVNAQKYDTMVSVTWRDTTKVVKMHAYPYEGQVFLYRKPQPFSFVTQIPRTFAGAAKEAFNRNSLPAWAAIASTTALLVLVDQELADGVQRTSLRWGIDNERTFSDLIKFKLGNETIDIYELPGNLNSWVYSIGEGMPPLLIAAGMWGYGVAKKDYRSISTASQIVQAMTAAGFMTQFFKRTTGRESPFRASKPGGAWRPFPRPGVYQNDVSMYDAFPSGHMGTLVATYVVLTENYPEKKWIRPVGIAVMSLVGLSMLNNGVHWAGDYPLAVGLGYAFGRATVKLNRVVKGEPLVPRRGIWKKQR